MIKRAVLFTGLVRNEAKFLDFLGAFANEPTDGRPLMLFSTWAGELTKYPAIADALTRLGATIFEQDQPDLLLPGHALHQIVALDLALSALEPDIFVYKSRPDFADIRSYKRFLSLSPIPVSSRPFRCVAAHHKLHIHGFFGAHPLYINDITYCGVVRDLLQLTNLPFATLIRYTRLAPEQLIWGGAIINQVRILDRYFRSNVGLIFNDRLKTLANIELLRNSACYMYALASYFMILDSYFENIFQSTLTADSVIASLTLEDLLWSRVDNRDILHHETAYTNSVRDVNFVRSIIKGELKPSAFGDQIQKALHHLRGAERPDDFLSEAIETSSATYGDAAAALEIRGSKAIKSQHGRVVVGGARPLWTQQQTGTPLTQALENQVNQLRRANNELQERLKKAHS